MIKKFFEIYKKNKEIINYLIVGALTTFIALGAYYICVFTFLNPQKPIELQTANIISWVSGVSFAYITNRKFVFESKEKNIFKEAVKFTSSRVITLILDMLIMWIGVTVLSFSDKIIKLISQIVVVVGNYIFSKIFVFNKKEK